MAILKNGTIINDRKPVSRSDYGIRVARKGYDASICADSDLLFNSGWPIIQIVKVISEENKKIYIDETQDIPSTYTPTGVVRIDGIGNWNCAVDEKWFYLPKEFTEYYDSATGHLVSLAKQYRIYHGLGYMPLFFKSEFCADVPGYYLMTNIDIRKDVDYPYTSAPSKYYGGTSDYGIKSKSYTRNQMPSPGETRGCGINTSIQSKLVMAVKTEKSKAKEKYSVVDPISGETIEYEAGSPIWAVPQDDNSQTTRIYDYEAFGFWSPDGKILQEYPVGVVGDTGYETYLLIDQWGASMDDTKKSLVILRSPIVAPDYEELAI